MRITNSHRGHTTNLAKCTKMTEGEHRIHGMNGVSDNGGSATKEETPHAPDTYNLGGRLKFFKDGRFILELARAREGEKVAWVPVPKKTFWPPQGSASSVSTYRQESSTSLSVSDDNSSVQSSPWQRDHTWKQTSPQRNASSHLTFFFWAPRRTRHRRPAPPRCVHRLQRSPYISTSPEPRCNKCNTTSVSKSAMKPSLVHIVQLLWNKSLQAFTSPRKRILRELERVTIDDLSLKRCRGKVVPPGKASEVVVVVNGVEEHSVPPTTSAKNCSYSITSLLGKQESREREEKLSSQSILASKGVAHHRHVNVEDGAVVVSAANNYGQDVVDGVPRAAEILCNKRSPVSATSTAGRSPSLSASPTTPSSEHYVPGVPGAPGHYPPHPAAAYMSPYHMYGVLGPPPGLYYNAYNRGYFPSPGPGFIPPHAPHAPHHQPYSWPLPPTTYDHPIHADDSDVPLNLSKHAD